ncbi:MAG: NnrU family protein, partial [Roseobacter sp.]|nr:NnrU family protein [Roseobacter sp.]
KSRIAAKIGHRGFGVSYSILSIAMLTMLIWSAGKTPYVELWPQMVWHRHVVHLGMLIVCLILAFSIARPNPFSFGGARNDRFESTRPGIVRMTRHPVLIALALWAGLHLLPNGDVAHVLLFGVLGSFALAGRALVNRRKCREMGAEQWNDLNVAVGKARLFNQPLSWIGATVRIIAAIAGFAALFALHPVVIGVPAL